jgi:hypothetical protein
MGCGCNDVTPCAEQDCGCKFEVDAGCVRYTNADLSCIDVSKGDLLSTALANINEKFCNIENTTYVVLTTELAGVNCATGGVRIQVKDSATDDLISTEYVCNGESGYLTAKVKLTTTQTKALFSAPVIIVAAPGPGYAIELLSGSCKLDFDSAVYNHANTSIDLITDTATFHQFRSDSILAWPSSTFCTFYKKDTLDVQIVENQPVRIFSPIGDATLGDGIFTIYVTYRIITL